MIYKYKIYEDDDVLVINKPTGLLVHGSEHIKEETLADQLLVEYPHLLKIGEDPTRPGIMHRLDRLASGLLVIAKNQASFESLKEQFQKRKIKKYYTALVHGKIIKDEDEINFPIQRSTKGFKMAAMPATIHGAQNLNGRQAKTLFEITKRYINYTLLKVRIKTGRTHQIRVHLAAYGHAIVGDDIYGTKKNKEKNKKLGLNRIFLVAHELEFKDLHGDIKNFKIELPIELKELLKNVK
jgi:23S rRNA pseudouridine1911/1915/1917 synthase